MARSAVISLWFNIVVYLGILGSHVSHSQPSVPALYIFGDSTADVGTNHYLPDCRARADMLQNGIDFPQSKPTGRFSNGYNTIDSLAQLLEFDQSPPPFLSYLDSSISQFIITNVPTKGINFASGGSGLQDCTGKKKWGRVICFGEQVQQFSTVRSNISELLGASAVANISKSLFIISVGSNDIFDHFDANSTGRNYITTLISTYETHLRNLYELGARKFGIVSVAAIGCCPINLDESSGDCKKAMNDDAKLFYTALRGMLQKLSSECKGLVYALGDAFSMAQQILKQPKPVFDEVNKACCGKGGKWKAEEACKPDSLVCGDRTTYLFWDQYHPTQTASYLAASSLYGGPQPFVVPMNFGALARLP